MNKKVVFTFCLAALLPLTGCKKVQDIIHKRLQAKQTDAQAAAATPTPTPAPVAVATPAPEPPAPIDTKAEVVVILYHRIEGKVGGGLSIEPAEFERQMQAIKDAGLAVISMQDFLAWKRGEKTIPPKSVLITIDDGYVSSYNVAWPVLKKYGYPFTMFVYLNYIGVGGKSVTWDQLAEMRDAGVDIGCHTVSHLDLRHKPGKTTLPDYDSWLNDEIVRSKQVIEQRLGIRVDTIAYPFGLHNEKVHNAAKAAGYEAAFTTYGQRIGRRAPPLTLGRYDVTTKDVQGHGSFDVAISFQGMMAPGGSDEVLGQDAAVSMITQPMNGETITDPKPEIKANLSTMGAVDPASIEMRVSGIGLVAAKFDPATKMLTFQPTQPLRPGPVTVLISAKVKGIKVETRWSFNFNPNAKPAETQAPAKVP